MADTRTFGKSEYNILEKKDSSITSINKIEDAHDSMESIINRTPKYDMLADNFEQARNLVDYVVLKKYLHNLEEMDILPLDDSLKNISDIRIFKITEMVYPKDEIVVHKLATVFNAVQNLNCGVFIIVNSDGEKTDFYMGVRSLDNKRTTQSLKATVENTLIGQFPGVKTENLLDNEAENLLQSISARNIVSVSGVPQYKDDNSKNNDTFIQGLEKLALSMQGKRYTGIILAKSLPVHEVENIRQSYEDIASQLSPFVNMQMSYGASDAYSISEAFSKGNSESSSQSYSQSIQKGESTSHSFSKSRSVSDQDNFKSIVKSGLNIATLAASAAAAPATGGVSLALAAANLASNFINSRTTTEGSSESTSTNKSLSHTTGSSESTSASKSNTFTDTKGITKTRNDTLQLTAENKSLKKIIDRIDIQLDRIDVGEGIGLWESAAYFLSDSQETAEMAAGVYKSLIAGEQSGVEQSAINLWKQLPPGKSIKEIDKADLMRDYVTHFIHPVFLYKDINKTIQIPLTAGSLVNSSELAIQMGLPRKSVVGFPVIEHADFGKDVVRYGHGGNRQFSIGHIFSMGKISESSVKLDADSLTMHTFVTGSTGAGKSNTIYELLSQLRELFKIPFLVIEPAKGEYKNIFGHYPDVSVYGTNPNTSTLLKINPFYFPKGIHILEHLDRLVEIFNVCWPMYAAMPAILKEAMERAYIRVGWDLMTSENNKGGIFPNFKDLLEEINGVINESSYSVDSKGDYSGALLTRVRSLTNGFNGLIFSNQGICDEELFDKNVIVDLSRIGSIETKSLIMGILVMRLNEYRMSIGNTNSPLQHITVLEEAHNLLRKTSQEQSTEGSNLLGKSVELLANSIAEMRTYGEGFVIADQSPSLLDMSVIRNTNTKLILRLPDKGDRELVGYSAGLNEQQIDELAKLKQGVAAVYQNDWVEPILVEIRKCDIEPKPYIVTINKSQIQSYRKIKREILQFLLHGQDRKHISFSIENIENNLPYLNLSSSIVEFIEKQLNEYKNTKNLIIWKQESFKKLASKVIEILDAYSFAKKLITNSTNIDSLVENLEQWGHQILDDLSIQESLILQACLLQVACEEIKNKEKGNLLMYQWKRELINRGEI